MMSQRQVGDGRVGHRPWPTSQPSLIDREGIVVTQDHRTLDDVLQFPDVARPVVSLKQRQGRRTDRPNAFPGGGRIPLDEILDEQRYVRGAFPKGVNWNNGSYYDTPRSGWNYSLFPYMEQDSIYRMLPPSAQSQQWYPWGSAEATSVWRLICEDPPKTMPF